MTIAVLGRAGFLVLLKSIFHLKEDGTLMFIFFYRHSLFFSLSFFIAILSLIFKKKVDYQSNKDYSLPLSPSFSLFLFLILSPIFLISAFFNRLLYIYVYVYVYILSFSGFVWLYRYTLLHNRWLSRSEDDQAVIREIFVDSNCISTYKVRKYYNSNAVILNTRNFVEYILTLHYIIHLNKGVLGLCMFRVYIEYPGGRYRFECFFKSTWLRWQVR